MFPVQIFYKKTKRKKENLGPGNALRPSILPVGTSKGESFFSFYEL